MHLFQNPFRQTQHQPQPNSRPFSSSSQASTSKPHHLPPLSTSQLEPQPSTTPTSSPSKEQQQQQSTSSRFSSLLPRRSSPPHRERERPVSSGGRKNAGASTSSNGRGGAITDDVLLASSYTHRFPSATKRESKFGDGVDDDSGGPPTQSILDGWVGEGGKNKKSGGRIVGNGLTNGNEGKDRNGIMHRSTGITNGVTTSSNGISQNSIHPASRFANDDYHSIPSRSSVPPIITNQDNSRRSASPLFDQGPFASKSKGKGKPKRLSELDILARQASGTLWLTQVSAADPTRQLSYFSSDSNNTTNERRRTQSQDRRTSSPRFANLHSNHSFARSSSLPRPRSQERMTRNMKVSEKGTPSPSSPLSNSSELKSSSNKGHRDDQQFLASFQQTLSRARQVLPRPRLAIGSHSHSHSYSPHLPSSLRYGHSPSASMASNDEWGDDELGVDSFLGRLRDELDRKRTRISLMEGGDGELTEKRIEGADGVVDGSYPSSLPKSKSETDLRYIGPWPTTDHDPESFNFKGPYRPSKTKKGHANEIMTMEDLEQYNKGPIMQGYKRKKEESLRRMRKAKERRDRIERGEEVSEEEEEKEEVEEEENGEESYDEDEEMEDEEDMDDGKISRRQPAEPSKQVVDLTFDDSDEEGAESDENEEDEEDEEEDEEQRSQRSDHRGSVSSPASSLTHGSGFIEIDDDDEEEEEEEEEEDEENDNELLSSPRKSHKRRRDEEAGYEEEQYEEESDEDDYESGEGENGAIEADDRGTKKRKIRRGRNGDKAYVYEEESEDDDDVDEGEIRRSYRRRRSKGHSRKDHREARELDGREPQEYDDIDPLASQLFDPEEQKKEQEFDYGDDRAYSPESDMSQAREEDQDDKSEERESGSREVINLDSSSESGESGAPHPNDHVVAQTSASDAPAPILENAHVPMSPDISTDSYNIPIQLDLEASQEQQVSPVINDDAFDPSSLVNLAGESIDDEAMTELIYQLATGTPSNQPAPASPRSLLQEATTSYSVEQFEGAESQPQLGAVVTEVSEWMVNHPDYCMPNQDYSLAPPDQETTTPPEPPPDEVNENDAEGIVDFDAFDEMYDEEDDEAARKKLIEQGLLGLGKDIPPVPEAPDEEEPEMLLQGGEGRSTIEPTTSPTTEPAVNLQTTRPTVTPLKSLSNDDASPLDLNIQAPGVASDQDTPFVQEQLSGGVESTHEQPLLDDNEESNKPQRPVSYMLSPSVEDSHSVGAGDLGSREPELSDEDAEGEIDDEAGHPLPSTSHYPTAQSFSIFDSNYWDWDVSMEDGDDIDQRLVEASWKRASQFGNGGVSLPPATRIAHANENEARERNETQYALQQRLSAAPVTHTRKGKPRRAISWSEENVEVEFPRESLISQHSPKATRTLEDNEGKTVRVRKKKDLAFWRPPCMEEQPWYTALPDGSKPFFHSFRFFDRDAVSEDLKLLTMGLDAFSSTETIAKFANIPRNDAVRIGQENTWITCLQVLQQDYSSPTTFTAGPQPDHTVLNHGAAWDPLSFDVEGEFTTSSTVSPFAAEGFPELTSTSISPSSGNVDASWTPQSLVTETAGEYPTPDHAHGIPQAAVGDLYSQIDPSALVHEGATEPDQSMLAALNPTDAQAMSILEGIDTSSAPHEIEGTFKASDELSDPSLSPPPAEPSPTNEADFSTVLAEPSGSSVPVDLSVSHVSKEIEPNEDFPPHDVTVKDAPEEHMDNDNTRSLEDTTASTPALQSPPGPPLGPSEIPEAMVDASPSLDMNSSQSTVSNEPPKPQEAIERHGNLDEAHAPEATKTETDKPGSPTVLEELPHENSDQPNGPSLESAESKPPGDVPEKTEEVRDPLDPPPLSQDVQENTEASNKSEMPIKATRKARASSKGMQLEIPSPMGTPSGRLTRSRAAREGGSSTATTPTGTPQMDLSSAVAVMNGRKGRKRGRAQDETQDEGASATDEERTTRSSKRTRGKRADRLVVEASSRSSSRSASPIESRGKPTNLGVLENGAQGSRGSKRSADALERTSSQSTVNSNEPDAVATSSRKRRRKAKDETYRPNGDVEEDEEEPKAVPVKRKRGRPRKHPLPTPAPSQEMLTGSPRATTQALGNVTNGTTSTRRGRGQPRRSNTVPEAPYPPLSSASDTEPDEDEPAPKRRRKAKALSPNKTDPEPTATKDRKEDGNEDSRPHAPIPRRMESAPIPPTRPLVPSVSSGGSFIRPRLHHHGTSSRSTMNAPLIFVPDLAPHPEAQPTPEPEPAPAQKPIDEIQSASVVDSSVSLNGVDSPTDRKEDHSLMREALVEEPEPLGSEEPKVESISGPSERERPPEPIKSDDSLANESSKEGPAIEQKENTTEKERPSEPVTEAPALAVEEPSSKSSPRPRQRRQQPAPPLPPVHIPITRSHCYFQKISIPTLARPKRDGKPAAPYVFLVPACSFADGTELARDYDIKVLGPASEEEQGEAIHMGGGDEDEDDGEHAENWVDPIVISVLKKLVGMDIWKEGNCEVLMKPPQEDEEVQNDLVQGKNQENYKEGEEASTGEMQKDDKNTAMDDTKQNFQKYDTDMGESGPSDLHNKALEPVKEAKSGGLLEEKIMGQANDILTDAGNNTTASTGENSTSSSGVHADGLPSEKS